MVEYKRRHAPVGLGVVVGDLISAAVHEVLHWAETDVVSALDGMYLNVGMSGLAPKASINVKVPWLLLDRREDKQNGPWYPPDPDLLESS